MIAMALIHLCFGGDSPLGYVKNKALLIFFCHNCIIRQNDSTKQDYNLEGFSPIFPNIWLGKYDPLNILSSVCMM